jgi:predicted RNA binding protein YcfA (HicA-like mRNA interferase family)
MKIPRDLSGADLIKRLARLGYAATRQTGSHIRLTSTVQGEHHITLPNHDPLKLGTLAAILASIAAHQGITRDELLNKLFG